MEVLPERMKTGAVIALLVSSCNQVAPSFELLLVPDGGTRDATPGDTGSPVVPDAGELLRSDGLPCDDRDQCEGGLCLRGPDFPDGYCSSRCDDDSDCDRPDGVCVNELGEQFCARTCFGDGVCRAGYECRFVESADVCLPPPVMPTDGSDGSPCRSDGDCLGGVCFTAPDWPGGYCTTECFASDGCHPGTDGAVCGWIAVPAPIDRSCLQSCTTSSDCRASYACALLESSQRGCIPDSSPPPPLAPPAAYPFEMKCGPNSQGGDRYSFTYDVPAGATSYMITPVARDGHFVLPLAVDLPSGGTIDFGGENEFQRITTMFRPWIAPTLIPTVEQHAHQLEAGRHTYRVETTSRDLCWQLVAEEAAGIEIDLRVYFVGVPNLDAATAPMDPNFQQMLTRMAEVFEQVGLTISDVVYRDVSDADSTKYGMVMEEHHVGEIVALSEAELSDLDSALVMNLFFVETIGWSGGGVLGIASALPGPVALHGTQASGVITTAEYIGLVGPGPNGVPQDGNNFTALVAVHEIGHFLGLLHTTEFSEVPSFDPVLDTPQCENVNFDQCPDLGNVMFPFADPGNTILTEGQGFTIKKNPLSKEPP